MKSFFITILAMVIVFMTTALVSATADEMPTEQRLAIIVALRNQGIVGENNQGFLEFRGEKKAEGVVEAENRQRRAAYQAIAEKQGVSLKQVGATRAAQIAEDLPVGAWIQRPDGSWYRKQ